MLIFTKGTTPLFSTGKNDWETPPALFEEWDREYHFILDAAANEKNHKCARWFGPGGECPNALCVPWPLHEGNIWLNPPYGTPQKDFVRKAWKETQGKPFSVVCLLPARTDTKLFHEILLPHSKALHFLPGRVKFVGAHSSAPFPSMIVVL